MIPLLLPLTVGGKHFRTPLAALFLVVRMFLPPLLLAVTDDLAIQGIGRLLLAMIISPPLALALGLAADHLLRSIDGRDEETLTVRTGTGRAQADSSALEEDESEENRNQTYRQDLETTVECLPPPRQQGLSLIGSLVPAYSD